MKYREDGVMSERRSQEPVFVDPATGRLIRPEEMERRLQRKLKENLSDPDDALWELAWFYSVTGRLKTALSYVERIATCTGNLEKKAACYLAMGQLMEQMQQYDSAISYYREALTLEPVGNRTWYLIHNNLGYCLNHFGRYKEAEPYCREAIGIDPERHNAHENLGVSLEGQGRYVEAARCYLAAARKCPFDPRARKHLEALVEKHAEIELEIPDIRKQLL